MSDKTINRRQLIDVAMGYSKADKVILNGKIVNTHTGTVHADDIAIKGDRIAVVGNVDYTRSEDCEVIDAKGQRKICSRFKNKDLFDWTFGGRGLTGIVAKISWADTNNWT